MTLKEEEEVFIATGLYREKPKSGVYIRGRIASVGSGYRVKYGIEAYFMPKQKALAAERSVRQGANAASLSAGQWKSCYRQIKL